MKKIIRSLLPVLMLLLLLTAIACDTAPSADICVSIPPQAYLVKRIAGEDTPVTIMIPPGSAPPTYSPTGSQIRNLHDCKLYIKNGHPAFHFEIKHINPFLENHPEIYTVNMADSIDVTPGDAHIWLSPRIMRISAGRIYKKLILLYPEQQDIYSKRYEELIRDIDALDSELKTVFASHQNAEFLTLHPSWGYFSNDYGIKQISIRHENKAPSARRLAELIEHARENNIKIIFVQKEFSSEQLNILSREIGAEIVALDPLNESWLENLRQTGKTFLETFNEQ